MVVTNRRVVQHTDADFYRTPTWATRALLTKERFDGSVLDPCCGTGDITDEFVDTGHRVWAYDLVDRGYGDVQDALRERRRPCNIVTNPPYNIVNELTLHWLRLIKRKLALLLRVAFLEGAARYEQLFATHPPARVWVFTERVTMYPGDSNRTTGGTTCYAWIVWDTAYRGPPIIGWIEPGWKPNGRQRVHH